VKKLPALQTLNLRECSNVAVKTTTAVAQHCRGIETINMSGTAVSPLMLEGVLRHCSKLRVLKLASLSNWVWYCRLRSGLRRGR
jgi:hypothetical protein